MAPLTSTIRPYPFRVKTVISDMAGQAALDGIRGLDKARLTKRMASLPEEARREVLPVLRLMFAE